MTKKQPEWIDDLFNILTFSGKYEPTPAELERWQEKHRRQYQLERLEKLIFDLLAKQRKEIFGRIPGKDDPMSDKEKFEIIEKLEKESYET